MTGEDRDGGASVPATDEALAARALGGDPDALMALLTRYRWMLRVLARRYFLPGGDVEDLIQEASLGFVRAVRDYRPQLGIPFRPFAELCATRQVITAVKSATRQKHQPLNSAVSLHRPRFSEDDDSPVLGEVLADGAAPSPEQCLEDAEAWFEVRALMEETLSPYERRVFRCYLDGLSYQEIAETCGTHLKSVDNALWRVKCKLRRRGSGPAGTTHARCRELTGSSLQNRDRSAGVDGRVVY
jgi:RNA polymerase sporulation-specific sigma factor